MKASKHAQMRGRGRMGLNKKSIQRQIDLALEKGIKHKDMKGQVRKWVDYKILKNGKEFVSSPIIYNNHLFLMRNGKVITMLPIPGHIHKKLKHTNKNGQSSKRKSDAASRNGK